MGHRRPPPAGLAEAPLNNIPLSPLCVFGKVIPIHTSLLRFGCPTFVVSPSILYASRCVRSQGLSLRLGPAMGIYHELEENPALQHQQVQRLACHGRLSKAEGLSLLLAGNRALSTYSTLQNRPSRERLGLPSLAHAQPLSQYPLQPKIATQNSNPE